MAEGLTASVQRTRARAPASGATTDAAGGGSSVARGASARPLAPVVKRPLRLPEVVLGVLLVAGCALAAVLWQRSNDSTTTVVVAGRAIARGSVIGPDDLRGAQLGGETSAMISGDSAAALLGKIAAVDIDVDVPMTPTLLVDAMPLGVEEALTSVALAAGRLPPDLSPNDHVRIVVSGRPDATGGAVTALIDKPAVVWSVDPSDDGVSTIVTLRGPLSLSVAIAGADQVQLVTVEGS